MGSASSLKQKSGQPFHWVGWSPFGTVASRLISLGWVILLLLLASHVCQPWVFTFVLLFWVPSIVSLDCRAWAPRPSGDISLPLKVVVGDVFLCAHTSHLLILLSLYNLSFFLYVVLTSLEITYNRKCWMDFSRKPAHHCPEVAWHGILSSTALKLLGKSYRGISIAFSAFYIKLLIISLCVECAI